jgi:hypothetical protein
MGEDRLALVGGCAADPVFARRSGHGVYLERLRKKRSIRGPQSADWGADAGVDGWRLTAALEPGWPRAVFRDRRPTVGGRARAIRSGARARVARPLFALPGKRSWKDYDVAPDGSRFLAIVTDVRGDEQPLSVVLNWTAALDR